MPRGRSASSCSCACRPHCCMAICARSRQRSASRWNWSPVERASRHRMVFSIPPHQHAASFRRGAPHSTNSVGCGLAGAPARSALISYADLQPLVAIVDAESSPTRHCEQRRYLSTSTASLRCRPTIARPACRAGSARVVPTGHCLAHTPPITPLRACRDLPLTTLSCKVTSRGPSRERASHSPRSTRSVADRPDPHLSLEFRRCATANPVAAAAGLPRDSSSAASARPGRRRTCTRTPARLSVPRARGRPAAPTTAEALTTAGLAGAVSMRRRCDRF